MAPMANRLRVLFVAFHIVSGCGGVAGTANTVPKGLSVIEDAAEDAYDQALAVHFADVATDAKSIDDAWRAFRSEAAAAGAPGEDLTAMDSAVKEFVAAAMSPADPVVLARASNSVSATMDELYALYEAPVPSEVLAMDYLGREVVLDARQADYGGASAHIDTLEATFGTIRNALVAADGSTVAAKYDASIAAMRVDVANEDAAMLETNTNIGLELVDRMEGVFTKASGG